VKLTIIYLISICLLWINSGRPVTFNKSNNGPGPLIMKAKEIYTKNYDNKKLAGLTISYVTGETRWIGKENRKSHKLLGIYHLFTPSGIHLTAVITFIFFLLKMFRIKNRYVKNSVVVLTCLTPFFLPKLFSMKRVSLMRFVFLITSKIKWLKNVSPFYLFLASFGIDFLVGTYSHSQLSFAYSFLFLGIIMAVSEDKIGRAAWPLLGGQIIISFFQQTSVSLVGPFLGFALTALFTLLFPLIFFLFWVEMLIPITITEYVVAFYISFVEWSARLASFFQEMEVSALMLALVVLLSVRSNFVWVGRFKLIVVLILAVFHSVPAWNHKKYLALNPVEIKKNSRIQGDIIEKRVTSTGFINKFKSGKICSHKLYEGGYSSSCRR